MGIPRSKRWTAPGDGADSALLIDDTELEGLRPRGSPVAPWRWSPGFNAGMVEAELRIACALRSASR